MSKYAIRKLITFMLVVLLSGTFLSTNLAWAKDIQPPIAGQYGIAIDAVTGEVLYNKRADEKAYPASMTKVLTSIVLDEKVKVPQLFTVSADAAGQECSCFGLKPGEKISNKDAMFGLLLLSANDLAVAIAENVAGSLQGFAQLMNDEIKKLGLQHTHFVTPNGLHDPNHYTTAHDMALIMKEALKHPEVLKALSTQTIRVHTSLGYKTISNTSMVHTQPVSAHVIAGKTGFTNQAGNTLVEYLKEGDKEVIAVVMKSRKIAEYSDIQTMANYAFAHMKIDRIASKGEVISKEQINGEKVDLIVQEDIMIPLKNEGPSNLTNEVHLLRTRGDIQKGEVVANLEIIKDGQLVKEVPLVTDKAIQAVKAIKKTADEKTVMKKSTGSSGMDTIPGIIIIVLACVFVIVVNVQDRKNMMRK